MDIQVRRGILEIIQQNKDVLKIAIRQRAKFEGWLKFELASHLEKTGYENVRVESTYELRKDRSDISFMYKGDNYEIELKTPNTNYRIKGIENKGRPITKNIESIITDAQKLKVTKNGIIAFVLFPVPIDDNRWVEYIDKIKNEAHICLDKNNHCTKIDLDLNDGNKCGLIVCAVNVNRTKARQN